MSWYGPRWEKLKLVTQDPLKLVDQNLRTSAGERSWLKEMVETLLRGLPASLWRVSIHRPSMKMTLYEQNRLQIIICTPT